MSSESLRVAVVGCGDISAPHIDAVLAASADQVELVAVCDPDDHRRAAAVVRGGCPGFAELTHMLDVATPDVVHICTPHHRHADLAEQCLARDISVLLEKPLAHTVEAGEHLAAAAKESAALLGVCLQNRYNGSTRRLRDLLESGVLGRVLGGRASVSWHRDAQYYQRRDWRGRWETAGGGVLMNQAIHTLDLLQLLLGPITEVRGIAGTLALAGLIEVEDTAAMQLQHRSATGDIVASTLHATNGHVENSPVSIEIVTETARARLELDLTVTYRDGRVEVFEAAGTAAGERAYWGDSHAVLIDDFYRHVRTGTPFWIDASVALDTLRVIQAVYDQSPGVRHFRERHSPGRP